MFLNLMVIKSIQLKQFIKTEFLLVKDFLLRNNNYFPNLIFLSNKNLLCNAKI